MRSIEDVRNHFGYHPATPDSAAMHDTLRSEFQALAERVHGLLPETPTRTRALNALHSALMLANLAVALDVPLAEPGTGAIARQLPKTHLLASVPSDGQGIDAGHPLLPAVGQASYGLTAGEAAAHGYGVN